MSSQSALGQMDNAASKIPVPEVDLGDYYFYDGYNVSKILVEFFANLTRYNANFKPTSATLLGDEKLYIETLGIYAAMAGIVAIGLTIFLILFCCCNCLFRSAAPRGPKKKAHRGSNRSSCILGFIVSAVAIAGAASFVIGFIGEVRINQGAEDTCNTATNVSSTVKAIQTETSAIQNNLNNINLDEFKDPIANMEKLAAQLGSPEVIQQVKTINDLYKNINETVTIAKDQIKGIMQTEFLETIVKYTDEVNDQCPTVTKWIRVGSLVVLIVLAISSLLFIIGLCNNCLRSIFALVGFLAFTILILFGIVSFLALIAGSDFCLESKQLIEKQVQNDMVGYYLYCDKSKFNIPNIKNAVNHRNFKRQTGNVPNFDLSQIANLPMLSPNGTTNLDDLFKEAQKYIDMANNQTQNFTEILNEIHEMVNKTCTTYLNSNGKDTNTCDEIRQNIDAIQDLIIPSPTNPNALLTKMNAILDSVVGIMDQVDCTHITELINITFSTVCTKVYEAFFFFLINSVAATICFYILLLLSIWMLF